MLSLLRGGIPWDGGLLPAVLNGSSIAPVLMSWFGPSPALVPPLRVHHPSCSLDDFSLYLLDLPICTIFNNTRIYNSTASTSVQLFSDTTLLDTPIYLQPTSHPNTTATSSSAPTSGASHRLSQDLPTPPSKPASPFNPTSTCIRLLLTGSFCLVISLLLPLQSRSSARSLAHDLIDFIYPALIFIHTLPYQRLPFAVDSVALVRTVSNMEHPATRLRITQQALVKETEARRGAELRAAGLEERVEGLRRELAKFERQHKAASKTLSNLRLSLLADCDPAAAELLRDSASDDLHINVRETSTVAMRLANILSADRMDMQRMQLMLKRHTDIKGSSDNNPELVARVAELEHELDTAKSSVERESAARSQAQAENKALLDTHVSLRRQVVDNAQSLKQRDAQIATLQRAIVSRDQEQQEWRRRFALEKKNPWLPPKPPGRIGIQHNQDDIDCDNHGDDDDDDDPRSWRDRGKARGTDKTGWRGKAQWKGKGKARWNGQGKPAATRAPAQGRRGTARPIAGPSRKTTGVDTIMDIPYESVAPQLEGFDGVSKEWLEEKGADVEQGEQQLPTKVNEVKRAMSSVLARIHATQEQKEELLVDASRLVVVSTSTGETQSGGSEAGKETRPQHPPMPAQVGLSCPVPRGNAWERGPPHLQHRPPPPPPLPPPPLPPPPPPPPPFRPPDQNRLQPQPEFQPQRPPQHRPPQPPQPWAPPLHPGPPPQYHPYPPPYLLPPPSHPRPPPSHPRPPPSHPRPPPSQPGLLPNRQFPQPSLQHLQPIYHFPPPRTFAQRPPPGSFSPPCQGTFYGASVGHPMPVRGFQPGPGPRSFGGPGPF
ncbi:hypothetical protein DENSPDRAFT_853815 [Dentipellis sp. KUC8613]|nr:hypothetical protein DENSPDRAFT_853815 [Dentipellis sp. KUC8613]